jgi:DNA-binding transcriptional LysR family regulator
MQCNRSERACRASPAGTLLPLNERYHHGVASQIERLARQIRQLLLLIDLGAPLAQDRLIAVRIGPNMRMAVVAAPGYFATRERPKVPQDLTAHRCINLRMPTRGGLYVWEFEKRGREVNVRVEGQVVFNNIALRLNAALAGFGVTYLPEDQIQPHLAAGSLVRVLEDWCPPFSGYHLYYPSRRQQTPAFALLVEALRYRGAN